MGLEEIRRQEDAPISSKKIINVGQNFRLIEFSCFCSSWAYYFLAVANNYLSAGRGALISDQGHHSCPFQSRGRVYGSVTQILHLMPSLPTVMTSNIFLTLWRYRYYCLAFTTAGYCLGVYHGFFAHILGGNSRPEATNFRAIDTYMALAISGEYGE